MEVGEENMGMVIALVPRRVVQKCAGQCLADPKGVLAMFCTDTDLFRIQFAGCDDGDAILQVVFWKKK